MRPILLGLALVVAATAAASAVSDYGSFTGTNATFSTVAVTGSTTATASSLTNAETGTAAVSGLFTMRDVDIEGRVAGAANLATVGYTIVGSGAFTPVSLTTEYLDTHGEHSTSVNPDRIYPSRAGVYAIQTQLAVYPLNFTTAFTLTVVTTNGGTVLCPCVPAVATGHYYCVPHVILVYFTAADIAAGSYWQVGYVKTSAGDVASSVNTNYVGWSCVR